MMGEKISFGCQCGKLFEVSEKLAGETRECPNCKNMLRIPAFSMPPPATARTTEPDPPKPTPRPQPQPVPVRVEANSKTAQVANVIAAFVMFFSGLSLAVNLIATINASEKAAPLTMVAWSLSEFTFGLILKIAAEVLSAILRIESNQQVQLHR